MTQRKQSTGGAPPHTPVRSQCRWAIANGGDGFLLCARDADHDEAVEAHCTIYEHPEYGAVDAPAPGTDRREWFPEWLWTSVLGQDRERFYRRVGSGIAIAARSAPERPAPRRRK